jgi:hypothetical protein
MSYATRPQQGLKIWGEQMSMRQPQMLKLKLLLWPAVFSGRIIATKSLFLGYGDNGDSLGDGWGHGGGGDGGGNGSGSPVTGNRSTPKSRDIGMGNGYGNLSGNGLGRSHG